MKGFSLWCLSLVLIMVLACSDNQPKIVDPPSRSPLTMEAWEGMPFSQKYDGATLDRLRMADPKLKSDRAWHKFMKEVVIPAREKDSVVESSG